MIDEARRRAKEETVLKIMLIAALGLAAVAPVRAAEGDPDDVLRIYGPPRNRVRTLSARVARQKVAVPIITAWFEPADRPAEATAEDMQRWLNRDPISPMRTVGQTPTAAPGPAEYPMYARDIIVE